MCASPVSRPCEGRTSKEAFSKRSGSAADPWSQSYRTIDPSTAAVHKFFFVDWFPFSAGRVR